jgi:hypothetical protein
MGGSLRLTTSLFDDFIRLGGKNDEKMGAAG